MLHRWILSDFPLESHQIAEMMYSLSRKIFSAYGYVKQKIAELFYIC